MCIYGTFAGTLACVFTYMPIYMIMCMCMSVRMCGMYIGDRSTFLCV